MWRQQGWGQKAEDTQGLMSDPEMGSHTLGRERAAHSGCRALSPDFLGPAGAYLGRLASAPEYRGMVGARAEPLLESWGWSCLGLELGGASGALLEVGVWASAGGQWASAWGLGLSLGWPDLTGRNSPLLLA